MQSNTGRRVGLEKLDPAPGLQMAAVDAEEVSEDSADASRQTIPLP
ncbi:hypothetical protein [Effusibacillus consociatus]|uniref:Uncharacterized protein n=1 Tax=Effusibacillus consociatus TaxID=1117041 RepID=A0ABV9PVB8_9BACL